MTMRIDGMTPRDLAPYICQWCEDEIAARMLQRLRDADYPRTEDVPEFVWDQMLHRSMRECDEPGIE
jgi:hypothetical protein